jgi:hypothetical protein
MKKRLLATFLAGFFAAILIISSVSAIELEVNATGKVPVIVSELKDPAIFDLTINNKGAGDNVEIYSLIGVSFEPKEKFYLPSGESTIEVKAYPNDEIRATKGTYAFEYQIKGSDANMFKANLVIKIVNLKDVFEITPQSIAYGSDNAVVKVRNVNNIEMKDVTFHISSLFFDGEKTLSLEPFASTDITLPVKSSISDIAAGSYVVTTEIGAQGVNAEVKSSVSYTQEKSVTTSEKKSGFLVVKTTITKTNNGNLAVSETTVVKKNILTRLFTTFSEPPLSTERKDFTVYYKWGNELNPGETMTIVVTTNYTLPFILILLVILGVYFVYAYSRTSVVLKKRCYFVKTKGGEFALKVMLNLKAKKAVDNIEIFDRIPMATKLYQKAGMPHGFDEKNGKLSWKIDRLNAGEDRIFSYIIYSNIRIVGRLELSQATAHFVKDGKPSYIHSNRTFFVSDIAPRY